jgi:UDP:flavonoid glycosyltransferase YjiC (YdhE family)
MINSFLPTLNRARAAYGLPPHRHIFSHYDRADRVLIGLSKAFDLPATRLPENLRYVGPLLDMPAWTHPWTAPWSKEFNRPRILVSLSTSFQNQSDLLRRISGALGTMDLDAVVTVGPAMEKETIPAPPNVVIIHSAPHDAVMKEVSLVVTHGGQGTVNRALVNHAAPGDTDGTRPGGQRHSGRFARRRSLPDQLPDAGRDRIGRETAPR